MSTTSTPGLFSHAHEVNTLVYLHGMAEEGVPHRQATPVRCGAPGKDVAWLLTR